jgi:hypothetical protein
MCAGEHLDRLGLLAVAGDRPQLVPVGARHVGQDVRVAGVALATRDVIALAEARRLQRVDRVDFVAGRDQRLHPRATVGLDAYHHVGLVDALAEMLADHRVQAGHACHALGKLGPGQHPAGLVLQLDVVVLLRPVVPDEQQPNSNPFHSRQCGSGEPAGELPAT